MLNNLEKRRKKKILRREREIGEHCRRDRRDRKKLTKGKKLAWLRLRFRETNTRYPASYLKGVKREELFVLALDSLKEKGMICGYVASGNFSVSDIFAGTDYFVITMGSKERLVHRIDVTGPAGVKDHQNKNERVKRIVIPVECGEPIKAVSIRILEYLEKSADKLSA